MYPYTLRDDGLGRNKKRKDDGKRIFPEIVSGNLVIMRFSVIYVRGNSSVDILLLSDHVFHALFIPSLVSVSFEELCTVYSSY